MDAFPFRETVRDSVALRYVHKKIVPGGGEFAIVSIRIDPLPPGTGFEFANEVTGGTISAAFARAAEAGIREAARPPAAATVVAWDVRVTLLGGAYHEVDSNDETFRLAGFSAFDEAVLKADSVTFEPILRLTVVTPEEFAGVIAGDLNVRRAAIADSDGGDGPSRTVTALVRGGNLFGYSEFLAHLTNGRATCSATVERYDPLDGDDGPFSGAAAARVA